MKRPLVFHPVMFTVLIPLLLFGACGRKQQVSNQILQAGGDTTVRRIMCEPAILGEVDQLQTFTGRVLPFEENYVAGGIAGRIARLYVEVGDRVSRGQLLAELDQTQLIQQRLQLATLEKDYKRLDTLYKVGSVSQQQWEQVKSQYDMLRTAVANLERNTLLRSPINGVVTGRFFSEGELYTMAPSAASNGQAGIYHVMQVNPVKVTFSIPELQFTAVKLGMPVRVALDAYEGREFDGKIMRISPNIDPATHTFAVEASVPNGSGTVRPGMFARASLDFGKAKRVLISDLAVQQQRGSNEKYVFIIEGGKARRAVVSLGGIVGQKQVILSGVKEGEQVAVTGLSQLQDGARVEIVTQ